MTLNPKWPWVKILTHCQVTNNLCVKLKVLMFLPKKDLDMHNYRQAGRHWAIIHLNFDTFPHFIMSCSYLVYFLQFQVKNFKARFNIQ